MSDNLLTYEEAAARLTVVPMTVKRWAYAGHLQVVRIGPRVIRVRESEVRRLLGESAQVGA